MTLGRRIAGHEPDLVAQPGEPALDELDDLERDRRRAPPLGGLDPREHLRSHRRMDDPLELTQERGVGEDEPAEDRAIERAVGGGDCGAEPAKHEVMGGMPRRRDEPGYRVRVDHGHAELREPARHL